MRAPILLGILAGILAGCSATTKGVRTALSPPPPGEATLKLEVRGVDLSKFQLQLAPLLDSDGRPVSDAQPIPAQPIRPASIPTTHLAYDPDHGANGAAVLATETGGR